MRYKVLLTGSNENTISDLFYESGGSFECMTSSLRCEDIVRHIKYFQPDVILFCLPRDKKNSQSSMFDVKDECFKRNIYVVAYGSSFDCDNLKRSCPGLVSLSLAMPMSTEQIVQSIVDNLKNSATKSPKEDRSSSGSGFSSIVSSSSGTNMNIDAMDDLEKILSNMELGDIGLSSAAALPEGSDNEPSGTDNVMNDKLEEEQQKRRKHILIVDDDKGILKMVKSFLDDKYDVATALSGKVALKFLETKKTDLVLLDYEMPGDRGPAVLEKIRSNPATKDIPVIFLTGVTDREKITEVLALKPQGYLLKPINMQRLLDTVSENI